MIEKRMFLFSRMWCMMALWGIASVMLAQSGTVPVDSDIPGASALLTYTITNSPQNYEGTFELKNTGSKAIESWVLTFDWSREIKGSSMWGAAYIGKQGARHTLNHLSWNMNLVPGQTVQIGFNGTPGDTSMSVPVNAHITGVGDLKIPPGLPRDQLAFVYKTTHETPTSFTGKLLIANPNETYAWNGKYFAVWSVQFECTADISSITCPDGAVKYIKRGSTVILDLGWLGLFPLRKKVKLTLNGSKNAAAIMPRRFKASYVRSPNIPYPNYGDLPASWTKGKGNLTASDLMANPAQYYDPVPKKSTAKLIVYNPGSSTQIQLGQVKRINYVVNTNDSVRIWIPCKAMAMGLGAVYEFFKINPNYMAALGTKENFAAGIVPPSAGSKGYIVKLDGRNWTWPIVAPHPDGPYQQETPNFMDAAKIFPDFFPDSAGSRGQVSKYHDDYVSIKVYKDHPATVDPNWISSAISSGISLTVTRETLYGVPAAKYREFVQRAADPWAEMVTITFAYNRGIGNFFSEGILNTHRQKALATPDIVKTFNIGGFANHVPTVRAIINEMNTTLDDIYDAQLEWTDIDLFLNQLHTFYTRDIPSAGEWQSMTADVRNAFNFLAKHWGGNTVSFRYDFLTLLRVVKQYLPKPYNPRPTRQDWYYLLKGQNDNLGGKGIVTELTPGGVRVPEAFVLRQNYPNPFNPSTTIEYVLPSAAEVSLVIYDVLGRKVVRLVDAVQPAGAFTVVWNGNKHSGEPAASGVYLCRMVAKDRLGKPLSTLSRKMILLK